MAETQNPSNRTRTKVKVLPQPQFLANLEMWLINLSNNGSNVLFSAPDATTIAWMFEQRKFKTEQFDLTIELVDCIIDQPWFNHSNVTQMAFVCPDTNTYFLVKSCPSVPGMAIRTAKLQHGGMKHSTIVGDERRLGFDIQGAMLWMADTRFTNNGDAYFPMRWRVATEALQKTALLKAAMTQLRRMSRSITVENVDFVIEEMNAILDTYPDDIIVVDNKITCGEESISLPSLLAEDS